MTNPSPGIAGIAVIDAAGEIVFSSGAAKDSRIKALIGDQDWMRQARRTRLQPLMLDRSNYVILLIPQAEGELMLVTHPGSDAILDFITSVDFAYDIMEHFVTNPFEAMTVVDRNENIVYISPVHESFFGLKPGEARGRPVRSVIENTRLDQVVRTGKAEIGNLQTMRGLERVVSRVPIRRDGAVVGAVGRVMFKGPAEVQALSRRISALENEVEFYKRAAAAVGRRSYGLDDMLGETPAMQRLKAAIVKVAPLEIPVLIRGESGTGKELVAHALHRLSPRRDSTVVMVNAATLPITLVEAELFGYEPGAFTGADRKGRKGKFEQADGGTIFLDEIGDMPADIQAKLLRVLQDRIVEPVGGNRPREVDFRLVTATNRDLQELIEKGDFRLDLYYRISPIVIEVPPLRARIADIPLLADHFLRNVAERSGRRAPAITESAYEALQEQSWPGNVRQLRHEIERAFVFAENDRITPETLASYSDNSSWSSSAPQAASTTGRPTMKSIVAQTEQRHVQEALARHKGNKKRVAEELGISRSYLYKLLDESAV